MASFTRTVKLVAGLAKAVGVPLTTPVLAFSVSPAGKAPAVIVQAPYGATPPEALIAAEYTEPTIPDARLVGEIEIAGQTGVIVKALVAAQPLASNARTVNDAVAVEFGVPLITPVVELREAQLGKAPLLILKV